MKLRLNKKHLWLLAPVITILWLLILYYVEKIYPFGSGTIINYDFYEGGVPLYFQLYDAFHSGRLFYDFSTACGLEIERVLSLFTPSNLFMLLFERDKIIESTSYLLIFYLSIVSATSAYTFSKFFNKISSGWVILLSIMYTFCGYNIQYYTNIDWLIAVALYPLLILFALNMFEGKSKLPYFAVLTYLLVFHTYMSFFVVVSLVVFGGLYVFIVLDKEKQRKAVYSLGISTLASLIASAYSWISFVVGSVGSARFNMTENVATSAADATNQSSNALLTILNAENTIDIVSIFMFLGLEIAVATLIILWINFKKQKGIRKHTVFFTCVLLCLIAQIVFRSVNLIWHAGSHIMFPFRNGYMVAFFCCCIVGFFYEKVSFSNNSKKSLLVKFLTFIPVLLLLVCLVPYVKIFYNSIDFFDVLNNVNQTYSFLYPYGVLFALSIIILVILLYKNQKAKNAIAIALVLLMISLNTFSFIGCPQDSKIAQSYNEQYANCLDLTHNISKDELERVNNPDVSLISNYPFISKVSAISNWTHSLNQNQIDSFKALGFSSVYTRTLDSGGTAFSKALLRITDSVAMMDLNGYLYTKNKESDLGLKYYSNNYTLPVGLVFDNNFDDIKYEDYSNTFEYQNAIYQSLTKEQELFVPLDYEIISEVYSTKDLFKINDDENIYESIKVESLLCELRFKSDLNSAAYLKLASDDCTISEMVVNGTTIYIPNSLDYNAKEKNSTFPVMYNNNVLELGAFQNEPVTVSIDIINGDMSDIMLYSMDLNKIKAAAESVRDTGYEIDKDCISLSVEASTDSDIVFIPVAYSENWVCTINGEKANVKCVLDNFIGIEVKTGINNIELSYSHRSFYISLTIKTLLLVVGIIVLIVERKIKSIPMFIYKIAHIAFATLFGVAVLVIYVVPIVYSVIKII